MTQSNSSIVSLKKTRN